jgi:hypothetical protein
MHICSQILTWTQYSQAALNALQRSWLGPSTPKYTPDFTKTIVSHFAIHAGALACCHSPGCIAGRAGRPPMAPRLQQLSHAINQSGQTKRLSLS